MKSKLDKVYEKTPQIVINDSSKIVIMSDCHRGKGNKSDNFMKNKMIYKKALDYYNEKKFTYIELGDGDEMWEVDDYNKIIDKHIDIFKIIRKFYNDNRFIMVYGNHDLQKRSKSILEKYLYTYNNKLTNKKEPLLDNLLSYESLSLIYNENEIVLLHGHQVDFLNSNIWYLSRFLVRHIWLKLENIGLKDPTGRIKNYQVNKSTEKKLKEWSIKNNKILITGHTHRPIYPEIGDSLYFNDGSCIHTDGISCIEIENGKISLVKWGYEITNKEITIKRKVVEGNKSIKDFLNS